MMKHYYTKSIMLLAASLTMVIFAACNPEEPQPGGGGNGGGNGGDNPTSVPTVIIESISNTDQTTATVKVSITNTGGGLIQEKGVVYYTSESDSLVTLRSDSNENQFSVVMDNLNGDLIYFIKAYADNSLGTGYSEISMFSPGRPMVEMEITEVTKTSISVKTTISNFGETPISEKGICYGPSADLTYYNAQNITYGGDENEFYINLTDLVPGDKYYIRSFVMSDGELTYSAVVDTLTLYPWHYVTDIPGLPRTQAVSFAIGTKAYIGTGVYQNDMYLEDMWEYDTETGVWTQIANYPEGKVRGLTAFAVNGKGYVGLGYRRNGTNEGEKMNSFYEYDPVTNTWTSLQDYPGEWDSQATCSAFSMNGKGCVATTRRYGTSGADGGVMDVYTFDPNSSQWTKLTEYQLTMYYYFERYGSISVNAIGSDIYGFFRYYNGNWGSEFQSFYKYEMGLNRWIEKECPTVSITYTRMENFVMGDNFYLFSGDFYAGVHNNTVYKYYPETNTWTDNEVSEARPFRYNPVKFVIGNKLYYGGGDNEGNHTDLWVYDPSLE